MQVNLIADVKPENTLKQPQKSKSKDFDSALKDCEQQSKGKKDDDSLKEDNTVVGILGALNVQVPPQIQNVIQLSVGSAMPTVEATEKIGSVTDDNSNTAPQSEEIPSGLIDAGYTKLMRTEPLVNVNVPVAVSNEKAIISPDIPADAKKSTDAPVLLNNTELKSFNEILKSDVAALKDVATDSQVVSKNTQTVSTDILKTGENIQTKVSADTDVSKNQFNDSTLISATSSPKTEKVQNPTDLKIENTDTEITQVAVKTVKTEDSNSSGTTENKSKDDSNDFDNTLKNVNQLGQEKVVRTESFTPKEKVDATNQIADAVKTAVDSGRTEVRIHLNPEELGPISVRIVSQNGALSVQISADNEKTSQLIASSMHELSQSMQDKGLTMEKAEVTYADNGGLESSLSQQGREFSQNQQYQRNQENDDYTLPKWTVAMETGGKTASDSVAAVKPIEETPLKNSDSSYSILV